MAKKKEVVEDGSKSKLALAMEKLNKSYGKGTILAMDSKTSGEYDLISTGSIGFDYITLGIGGAAKGKLYELMGWEGTGKSTICGHLVADCQAKGGVAAYIDGEHAVDKVYFQALGVDTSQLLFAQPASGEEGFQIAEDIIKSGEVDLVIIDSDSSLIPKAAILDGEVGESTIGKKARLNSNAYPRLKNALVMNKCCVIVVSQYREKIGVMFGNPTTTQGGHALKYFSDVRVEVSKSLAKEGDVTYGNITKVKATKNKMAPPYRLSEFDIIYGQGIDKVGEILELGKEFELLEKYGKFITYKGTKYDIKDFKALVQDNPEFYDEIKQDIVNKIQASETPVEDANIPTPTETKELSDGGADY